MPLTPSDLPLLLAGPILRRVESDLVSVWIATSRACNVSLLLFDGADINGSQNEQEDSRAKWVSASQRTLQFGGNFHVLTVVLDLRVPGGNATRSGGATLEANRTFSYDLRIVERAAPTQSHNFRSLGLLDQPTPLGYDVNELPAFRTCPQELNRLVIMHGSCRQLFSVPPVLDDPAQDDNPFVPPPDWPTERPEVDAPRPDAKPDPFPSDSYPRLPKRDGLIWADALIEARGPTPMVERPHQLFLTGDQIYADQVSPALLPALTTLGRLLIGREELGADPIGSVFKEATLEDFPPAFRYDTVQRSAGFTTDDGESHLFSFGEFIAYYLLTWSPALWDLNLWPDLTDFNPANVTPPPDWMVRFIYDSEPVDDDTRSPDNFTQDFITLRDNLPDSTPDDPVPDRDAPPEEIATWYFGHLRDWIASKYWSPELFEWWHRQFRKGVPRVRRALANVPTYMLADDHDISDDWYASRQWREQVFTRPLGIDIVRNGLMAATIMQSWGNDPRRWATGRERELITQIATYAPAMAAAALTPEPFPRQIFNRLHELMGLPQTVATNVSPTFRPLVEYSYQIEGPRHRVLVIDGRTKRRYPFRTSQAGGIDYEGATGLIDDSLPTGLPGEEATGLFGDSPMAAALPPRPAGDTKITLVVTGVPVIGPEGMELMLVPFQRFARLLHDVDAESWAYEPATYEALLAALARYGSVVILSGDVHLGWSAALDYWSAPDSGPVSTARIVQLVSSGFTKDWSNYAHALRGHALSLDIFESATNATQALAERVGWGIPLRTALTPPSILGTLVTHSEQAHPFYRSRLKMKAPVVPTHGWPAGAHEARDPNWAWRAVMARDDRPDSTAPPNFDRRWTPVDLPPNPIDPSVVGWHAKAARRMAFGRVFAAAPNIGIVTFEGSGADVSVRHALSGELLPLADTGVVPTGLQPFIVHRLALAPLAPSTWNTSRPTIVDDGGWGVDITEPIVNLVVKALPRIWQGAADFGGELFEVAIPPVIDAVTREALLTDAATRISAPFRRRVLRELGPYALLTDAQIDALSDATIAQNFPQIGRFDAGKEARALVRPDLERLLSMKSNADPVTVFDDLLLIACSEWVDDRARLVSMIAGILITFRNPVTKHVPVVAGLLGGLWDLWRNRTFADAFEDDPSSGLLSLLPRAGIFAIQLLRELVNGVIQDHEKRPDGGPPIFTPELTLAALGIGLGQRGDPQRFTFTSGWEPRATPVHPGTRALARTADSMARQTLTMLIHPGDRARFEHPAQSISVTMVPPLPKEGDTEKSGSLVIGCDGTLRAELEMGAGVISRFELEGKSFHQFLWGGNRNIEGRAGGTLRITLLRPTFLDLIGADIKLTPAVSVAIGAKATQEEGSYQPEFTLRLALNDQEDRVTFLPDDDLLVQLLPTDGLALPIDAAIEWTLEHGYRFVGFGEATSRLLVDPDAPQLDKPHTPADDFDEPPNPSTPATEVVTPLNTRVGPITFHERRLEVTTAADVNGSTFTLATTATISVNVGPVRIAISGLGLAFTIHFSSEFENVDDLIDLSVAIPLPTGLAVSVDADVIAGGGFLQRIPSSTGAVTYRGGIALRLGERYDVTAFGVVETGGGRTWTLLALLIVRFSPPIPLTAGLSLTAVGGLIALNRTMDVDALRDAATGTQGTLDPVLLPDRPDQRFLELLPAIERFFPPAAGHQVVGLLAELEWRGDTARFAVFRLALLGELENLQFALYGTAQIGFPRIENPHILRIRASVEALYDHRAKFARFSLTLTEALLFESVHVTGGMALLIRWGERSEFAITIGGFHPSFVPFIPQGLREPPRLGAYWKPHSLVELSIKMYWALTSTSYQFGYSAHIEAGASWGGFRADADINFLVMTEPDLRFELDLYFRVTVFLFGCDLISASLSGALSGPGPWTLEGSVYWEVCGVSISKDFGPYHWGNPTAQPPIVQEARRVIGDALGDTSNWTVRRNPRLAVRLRSASTDALDPRDQIDIRQTRLPLGVALQVHDANQLSDAGVWTLQPASGGLGKISDLTDVFPTRRYLRKPPRETPFLGGLVSGTRVGGQGWSVRTDLAIVSDESLTEDLVLDSLPVPPQRVAPDVRVLLTDAMVVAIPAQSPERRWTRHLLKLEAVA